MEALVLSDLCSEELHGRFSQNWHVLLDAQSLSQWDCGGFSMARAWFLQARCCSLVFELFVSTALEIENGVQGCPLPIPHGKCCV